MSNPNWPSKTGSPSGGGRGNNPPAKKLNYFKTFQQRSIQNEQRSK